MGAIDGPIKRLADLADGPPPSSVVITPSGVFMDWQGEHCALYLDVELEISKATWMRTKTGEPTEHWTTDETPQ